MIRRLVQQIVPERLLIHAQALDHYLNGEPEIKLLRRVCDTTKGSVDIGANIGIYTYFLRKYSAQVYSYEPNTELAQRLVRLFPDVVVRHAAASDKAGEITLKVPVEHGRVQHELGSVAQDFPESAEIVSYTVPSVRIDDEGLCNVGFIKIDVEQHEQQVLRGTMETIRTSKPIIMTEVTPLLYPKPLPEVFRFVTDLGYEGWFMFEGDYFPFAEFVPETHANSALWGRSFMGTNVFFLPFDTDSRILAQH